MQMKNTSQAEHTRMCKHETKSILHHSFALDCRFDVRPGHTRYAANWVKIIGLAQSVGERGVWTGIARSNTPNFTLICVTPKFVLQEIAVC